MRGALAMPTKMWLFITLGTAALLTAAALFALVLVALKIAITPGVEEVLGAMAAFVSSSVVAWWLFRKLQANYTKLEARVVAVVFAVFMPMSLIIAIPVAQIPGGYAGFLGRPFGLIGAVAGIVVMTTVICFVPCFLALWITRLIRGAEKP